MMAAVPVPGVPVGDGAGIGKQRTGLRVEQRPHLAQLAKARLRGDQSFEIGALAGQLEGKVGDPRARAEQHGGVAVDARGAQIRR